jgi:multidrug efflux pump subunit AcrA (membrane-fusion protein)
MKNNIKSIAILLTALVALSSCEKKKEETAKAEIEPKVETFLLSKEKLTTELRLPAELTGFQQVDLYAKVSSFVKLLKVDIGTKVKKGQLLIVLEAPEISSQLAAAESRLKSMEAIYATSKALTTVCTKQAKWKERFLKTT